MNNFWIGFEKQAGFAKALGTLTGVRDFKRGAEIINKSVKNKTITESGKVVGDLAKRKRVAGEAMAGGLARMGITGGLAYHALRRPSGSQEYSI